MRKTKGEKLQPCVISMIKINSNVWLIGPPRPLHWHNLNKLKNRTRLKKPAPFTYQQGCRVSSLSLHYIGLVPLCRNPTKPPRVSGGVPDWKVRLSNVFTVSNVLTSLMDCKHGWKHTFSLSSSMSLPYLHACPTDLHGGRKTSSFSVTTTESNVCYMTSCVMERWLHPHALMRRADRAFSVSAFKLVSKYSKEIMGRLR